MDRYGSQQSGDARPGWIRGNVEEKRKLAESGRGGEDDKKYAVVITPEVVGVLTFFFSPIPGFVLLAINQGRMHMDDRRLLTLLAGIGVALMVAIGAGSVGNRLEGPPLFIGIFIVLAGGALLAANMAAGDQERFKKTGGYVQHENWVFPTIISVVVDVVLLIIIAFLPE